MPFPTDDRAWNDTLLYLLERRRPGERTLAPDEFADELPFVRPYSQQEGDEPAYAWVVVHKGMVDRLNQDFVRDLTGWAVPVFANEVFVVFAREPGFAMGDVSESDHARSLLVTLPQRAPEPAAQPAPAPEPAPAPAAAPPAEPQPAPAAPTLAAEPPAAAPVPPPAAPAGGLQRLRQQELRRLLREALRDAPGQRVLDLGCGSARLTGAFTEAEVLGLDRSPEVVAQAQAAHAGLPNYRFTVAEPADFEAPSAAFDAVLLLDTLPAGMDEAAALLGRAASQLRPGGLLFLSLDNSEALHRRLARLAGAAPQGNGFTLAEITGMLRAAGFRPLRADGVLLPVAGGDIQDDGILDTLRELGRLAGPAHADTMAILARRG
jgi:SAM-dependent methyltransferase